MRQRLLDALRFLPEGRYRQAERLVNAFVQGVEATRSWRALLLLTAYTVVEWILILACARAVLSAFGAVAQFGWVDVLIFMGFVAFGAVIQIPGVGGGVQVVSVLVLTELFRVSLEAATSMAMVFWIITFIVIVPPGLALALREGLSWSKIKQMGQETDA